MTPPNSAIDQSQRNAPTKEMEKRKKANKKEKKAKRENRENVRRGAASDRARTIFVRPKGTPRKVWAKKLVQMVKAKEFEEAMAQLLNEPVKHVQTPPSQSSTPPLRLSPPLAKDDEEEEGGEARFISYFEDAMVESIDPSLMIELAERPVGLELDLRERLQCGSDSMFRNVHVLTTARRPLWGSRARTMSTNTTTALKRWSCQDKELPAAHEIRSIHIYDFDNTLFTSPLPNKQLWNTGTFGSLQAQDFLYNGGWWHNPSILAATGQGLEKEEPRAWEGFWNERIVDLVRLSMQEPDTLNVLLTGRKESAFADLIGRMVAAKGLEFHMVCLQPSSGPNGELFSSTMLFKQALLRNIAFTYSQADELRIYEDRVKHVKGFRDFFSDFNKELMSSSAVSPRQPFTAEVIQVSEQDISMDPSTEIAEVQKMINENNRAILEGRAPSGATSYKIKRTVFYTGYLIERSDIEKLRTLVKLPANCPEHEVRFLANNILIVPRPAPRSILDRVGGIGAKMMWRVTGIAVFEQKVWAARVQPLKPGAKIYSENPTPCVVLATRRQAKPIEAKHIQNWQPVPENQAFEFETTVGEKVLLRIEEEDPGEDDYEAKFPNQKNARKHPREEDFPPLGASRANGKPQPRPQQRSSQNTGNASAWQNKASGGPAFSPHRGGGHAGRGGGQRGGGGGGFSRRGRTDGRGGGGGGRGRGRGGYRSLDDNVGQGYGSGGMQY